MTKMLFVVVFYLFSTLAVAFRHGKFHRQSLWQAFSSIDSPNQQADCETCSPDQSGKLDSPDFIIDPTTDPTLEELSNQNLIRIVNLETSDQQCNSLAWKCLGYRYSTSTKEYNNEKVFPKWREKHPSPPDLIGVQRRYDAEVDRPVRDASMALMRSVPRDFKGGVRNLEADGFRGYKLSELTPNKTRRAQVVNWLIYYREKLFGKTLEDLQREREEAKAAEDSVKQQALLESSPSERQFERHRLDDPSSPY